MKPDDIITVKLTRTQREMLTDLAVSAHINATIAARDTTPLQQAKHESLAQRWSEIIFELNERATPR